ncbi:MAG TPA: GNAT family N-acetyltransferase [Methanoculleus sp.]|nr:GNAT family N-acetyltransferase [Methanoculleus sp.]HPK81741.1 GNAT family N-acetyltransferase [Methanoculleus sp.]
MEQQVQVVIPNDPAFIAVIRLAVSRMASLAGFPAGTIEEITSGVEEAVRWIVDHAFPPGVASDITLTCAIHADRFEVRIVEHGIPFDPETASPALPRCRAVMDRIAFTNRGWAGKETLLAKDCRESAHPSGSPVPPASSGPVLVRPTLPDEAVEISRCAYFSYGYSYGYERVYHPDVLKALIRSGDLISFVAVDENTVIGHAGLLFCDDPGVAEIGLGFVNPPYRSRRVFSDLMTTVVAEAERRHLVALSGQAVCTHLYSQRSARTFGMGECALLLSRYTPLRFTGIADENQVRESILAVFRYISPPEHPVLYPPKHHAGILREIYDRLGVHPPFTTDNASTDLPEKSEYSLTVEEIYRTAQISVRSIGTDLIPRLRRELARLRAGRLEAVYIHLPLTAPKSAATVDAIENLGFFFAGLHLASTGEDLLTLQYLNNQILDYDTVTVASPHAGRLKEYIRERDPWQG